MIFGSCSNEYFILYMVIMKKTINVNGIEIDMTTYRVLDLYWLYVWDYNNINEIKKAIDKEVDKRQEEYKKEFWMY